MAVIVDFRKAAVYRSTGFITQEAIAIISSDNSETNPHPNLLCARNTKTSQSKMAANGLTLKAIVAMCQTNRGIGKAGDLPWRLKKELAHFARMTTFVSQEGKKNAVIMGHNTWKSIPEKRRPLAKRINVVLSRTVKDLGEGVLVCPTFEDALQMLQQSHKDELDTVWVIGGSSVYSTALKHGSCSAIYVTEILKEFECDVFLPEFPSNYKAVDVDDVRSDVQEEDGVQYRYRVYKKVD